MLSTDMNPKYLIFSIFLTSNRQLWPTHGAKCIGFFSVFCIPVWITMYNLNNVGKSTGRVIISVRRFYTHLFRSPSTVSFWRLDGLSIRAINYRCLYIIVSWCGWTLRILPPMMTTKDSSNAKIIYECTIYSCRKNDEKRYHLNFWF